MIAINELQIEKDTKSLILNRSKTYGDFSKNASFAMDFYNLNKDEIIAKHKSLDLQTYNMPHFYIFMIGAKLARLEFNPTHKDSIRDLKGYTAIYKVSCDIRFQFKPLEYASFAHKNFVDDINELLNKD